MHGIVAGNKLYNLPHEKNSFSSSSSSRRRRGSLSNGDVMMMVWYLCHTTDRYINLLSRADCLANIYRDEKKSSIKLCNVP